MSSSSRYRRCAGALNDLERILSDETAEAKALPLSLLEHITDGFSADRLIGSGGFGAVYKGILRNGTVAVKRFHRYNSYVDEVFQREVKCLMKAKHKNIVRLLGYYAETRKKEEIRVTCFEYLSKSSLDEYITDRPSSGLEWRMRYQIIKGICQGLHYLHKNRIVHLDLKPSIVLLDDDMVPKIGGFGISRCFEENQTSLVSSEIIGTLGYISPEYMHSGVITIKSDMYSLGVTICNILSGEKINHNNYNVPEVLERLSTRLKESLVGAEIRQIQTCLDLALECCELDPDNRPDTKHIIERLEETETTDQEKTDIVAVTAWIDRAMENPVVTASIGPMAPVMRQIKSLTVMDPRIQGNGDLKRLKEHLEVLCGDLLGPEEDTNSTPKWWRKEVRELLYDTEDLLLSDKAADLSEAISGLEDAIKIRQRFQLPPPNKTINHIPRLGEAKGVSCLTLTHRQTFLELSMPTDASGSARRPSDESFFRGSPRKNEVSLGAQEGTLASLAQGGFSAAHSIIVVEEFINKLVEQLAFDDHNQKQLKVVPILGLPGVGKTTAAATLYHRYRGNFQCSAFVRVSPTPDTRSLLVSILSQTKAPRLSGLPDVHDLFYGVKKHLKGKRFFIVMDDLWTASVWDIISRAFPDGDYGSRIITITQIHDVALACCRYYPEYVLEMSPLNDDESRRLFVTRIFGSEDRCPSDHKEASYEIVKKCADLPLAIVIVASLLARELNLTVEKLEGIKNSLPSILRTIHTFEGMDDLSSDTVAGSEGNQLARVSKIEKWKRTQDSLPTTLEGLKEVLSFIYNNLPPHLLTCLLYLSMYPEGYLVRKHDLVRQWVAEGFVVAMEGWSADAVGASYFDELVSSGMVQPVYTKHGSEVLSCTVHHMILDLIRQKSKEMNFVITVDYLQSWLALPDEVRRLSLQFGGAKTADIPENILISKVRSLLFSGFFECVPSLVDYLLLRVLILHVWADGDETSFDLTGISKLLRLRYLKIQCNMSVNLPHEISGLKHLETLEVDASLSVVPSDIVHLKKLLHLLLPSEAILPQGIGGLTSLLTLGCFDLSKNSTGNVIDLAKLTNLQDLRLTWSTIPSEHLVGDMEVKLLGLGWILENLDDLRFLTWHGAEGSRQSICDDGLIRFSNLPRLLEKLELLPRICTLSRLPEWIEVLSRLTILKIEVLDLSDDDFATLKGLKSLTALSLTVLTEHAEWIELDEGFPVLKYFKFVRTAPYIEFFQGAMPNVQKLKLAFNANRIKLDYKPEMYGFKHMSSLTEVSVKFGGANADESIKQNAERVFKEAFINHQNSLIFNIQWVDSIF